MVVIKKKAVSAKKYAEVQKNLVVGSKPCNQRDLSCSFRPNVLIAPPR